MSDPKGLGGSSRASEEVELRQPTCLNIPSWPSPASNNTDVGAVQAVTHHLSLFSLHRSCTATYSSPTRFVCCPYSPKGSKAKVTFTTSPYKKRKLSPSSESIEKPHTASADTNPSSPPQLVASDGPAAASSPSPPRFLPPHLIAEGAKTGRSTTPEPPETGGSSPSAAYAGLNIDSDSSAYGSGQEATTALRRGSITRVGLRGGDSIHRTLSPAKRRASTMVGGGAEDHASEDVDMGESTVAHQADTSIPSIEVADTSSIPRRDSKSQGSRHKREISADMMGQDADKSAYQTPHSGTSSTGSTGAAEGFAAGDVPTIDDQISQVMDIMRPTQKEGQKGYIVASKWLSRVLSRGSDNDKAEKDKAGKTAKEGPVGPVDNTGIEFVIEAAGLTDEDGEPFIPLRPGLQISEDFEVLPEAAWKLVMKWYGLAQGSPVITRYCHNTAPPDAQENLQWEIYPPILTCLKLPHRSVDGMSRKELAEKNRQPIKILASRHERFQNFLGRTKEELLIDRKTKVRVWIILGGLTGRGDSGMMTPDRSRSSSPAPGAIVPVDPGRKLVLDVNTFANLQLGSEREALDVRDETANENYNGRSTMDFVGLRQDCVVVLEEQIGGPAGGEWVSDAPTAKARANGVPLGVTKGTVITSQNSLKPSSNVGSRGSSPGPGAMVTRGRQAKSTRTRGTTGLNNLGNTCYMNSALQCVRSVEELTTYFLDKSWTKDLNEKNPLGKKGDIAKAYANFVVEMYTGANTSFAPRPFKNIVGKHGSSFSGYQQQDSQEFLLFLLDCLDEDLSRIFDKPYIVNPDSTDEMVNDPVALQEFANTCWELYKKRNDSVITDLFTGLYKSTVTCPICEKVSIIIEPFYNLTLQLPIENAWSRSVLFFPVHDKPVQVPIDINKTAHFSDLKEFVSSKFEGTDPKRMIVSEIYKHKFYKLFDDDKSISEETIPDTDVIAIMEIEDQPTNWPAPKKKAKSKGYGAAYSTDEVDIPNTDSPLADKMMVSLFNRRDLPAGGTRFSPSKEMFGEAAFIVLTREEARDYTAIFKKVLAKVATMTTQDLLKEDHGSSSTASESDTILTNAEDADINPKVHTESLESEDDLVDISMNDQAHKDLPVRSDKARKIALKSLPKMLRPDGVIPDDSDLWNMFTMKYLTTSNEMVPLGWSSLGDESKKFPAIIERCSSAQLPQRREQKSAMETINRTILSRKSPPSSDEDEIVDPSVSAQNQMQTNGSDSDDEGLTSIEQLQQDAPTNFKKPMTTYSKKGKGAASRQAEYDEAMDDANDNPLIKLGEAIILDWGDEYYQSLFMDPIKNQDDGMRGMSTWDDVPALPDPELTEKKRRRDNRKRNGVSLDECLDEFGKSEVLSEANAWYCPRCKEHRRAFKTFEIWKAPDILVVHLKRFSSQGRFRDKIDVRVDFPLQDLDLSSRIVVKDDKSHIYDLFAVDNHYGGLGGGHYTAFAQNYYDKTWYEYNDSSVSKRSNPQAVVVSAAAYLLFYRRRSTRPLGGPFFENLISSSPNDSKPSNSTTGSRAASPSGEGRRLDETSSPIGSSSALRGVGAAHQSGGGGPATELRGARVVTAAATPSTTMTGTGLDNDDDDDEELPPYSSLAAHSNTALGDMDIDMTNDDEMLDEGVGDMHEMQMTGPYPYSSGVGLGEPAWSFQNLGHAAASPDLSADAEHEGGDAAEQLFGGGDDADSGKLGSQMSEDRMKDFEDGMEQGPVGFGTPPQEAIPRLDVPDFEEVAELPVAEIEVGGHGEAETEGGSADELA